MEDLYNNRDYANLYMELGSLSRNLPHLKWVPLGHPLAAWRPAYAYPTHILEQSVKILD